MSAEPAWRLDRFEHELDLWADREELPGDLLILVLAWIIGRSDDPYSGVVRAEGFENLWHGSVPGTFDPTTGRIVTCSYWIEEGTRTVRCDNFGLQSP